jgi:protein tyrosine phosphatase (PTP) superfamily phosphohydrolase (DUF442 family)
MSDAPIVERVARAICAASGYVPDEGSNLGSPMWAIFIPEARASIAVQRELIQQLRDALHDLDEAYCRAGTRLDRVERMADRLRLVNARESVAAADAALREQP